MSYTTRVTGEFRITPPLSWREIKDSPFISPHWDASDLVLRVDETAVDTEDGQLVRKTASALVMRDISEYNCRNLMTQVQKAIDDFPGHDWSGRLDCEGEENTDLWRVVIRDSKAVRVEPRIAWPDSIDRLALRDVLAEMLDRARLASPGLSLDTDHDRQFAATALAAAAANFLTENRQP